MRKYVSIATAMMVGAVIGREKKHPALQKIHRVPREHGSADPALQKIHRVPREHGSADAFKNAHLDKPIVIR